MLLLIGVVVRILVGALLVLAGAGKLRTVAAERERWLRAYGILPSSIVPAAAVAVPSAELLAGGAPIPGLGGGLPTGVPVSGPGGGTRRARLAAARGPRPPWCWLRGGARGDRPFGSWRGGSRADQAGRQAPRFGGPQMSPRGPGAPLRARSRCRGRIATQPWHWSASADRRTQPPRPRASSSRGPMWE